MRYRRLEDLRVDGDFTKTQIAEYLGVHWNVYDRYEDGSRTIPSDLVVRLAYFYKTSTDYLLGVTDEKNPYPRIPEDDTGPQ